MSDDPQQPQWRRMNRPPLFDKIIDTLKQARAVIEAELVAEQEKLNRAKENQGGRRG